MAPFRTYSYLYFVDTGEFLSLSFEIPRGSNPDRTGLTNQKLHSMSSRNEYKATAKNLKIIPCILLEGML